MQTTSKSRPTNWRTTLMGMDIQRLEILAGEDLAKHVKVITIADDSETLDPYVTSELPSIGRSYSVWPRNNAGTIISSAIGVAARAPPSDDSDPRPPHRRNKFQSLLRNVPCTRSLCTEKERHVRSKPGVCSCARHHPGQ